MPDSMDAVSGDHVDVADEREETTVADLIDHQSVLNRAARLVGACSEVHRTFRRGDESGEPRDTGPSWAPWRRAIDSLRAALQAMYPDPLWPSMKSALAVGDPVAREAALVFLEADPWCFRSGYEKAELMRTLSRLDLPDADRARARRIVVELVGQPRRREFPQLTRLAASLDSPELDAALNDIARTAGLEVRERIVLLKARMANWSRSNSPSTR